MISGICYEQEENTVLCCCPPPLSTGTRQRGWLLRLFCENCSAPVTAAPRTPGLPQPADRPPRPPRRAPPHPLPSSELGAPRWLPCCHALSLHDLPSPVTPTPSARWRWLPHVQLRSDLNETLIALQLPTSLLHLVAHSNVTSFCERGLPSEPMSAPIARSNHSLHPLTMSPRHVRR